jgi:hypothetical protein
MKVATVGTVVALVVMVVLLVEALLVATVGSQEELEGGVGAR